MYQWTKMTGRILGGAALGALLALPAVAQEAGEAGTGEALSEDELDFSNKSDGALGSEANSQIDEMSGYLEEVRALKSAAEAKNATSALTCLNGKLEAIKGSLKTAEVSRVEMESALAESNRTMAERQLSQIVSVGARARKAYSQALAPTCSQGIGGGGLGAGAKMAVTYNGEPVDPGATAGGEEVGGGAAAASNSGGSVVGSDNLTGGAVDDTGDSDIVPDTGSENS